VGRVLAKGFAAVAAKYARDVIGGKVVAGRKVVAACARHLHDLQHGPARGLRFNPEEAARACRFIELLPHIKGKWAKLRERIVLQPWQVFIVANIFGWQKQTADRCWVRRFKLAYIEVARKNAKSTLAAGIALYMLAVDGEEGAEIFSAATTRGQARIVFDVARHMALRTPRYRERFGVQVSRHALVVDAAASSFVALSSDYDSLDGLNPHLATVDELHAHKNRALWDVLETAMGSREQPLLLAITTAGGNQTGICYEVRSYVANILETEGLDDDSVFGIIYTADDPEKWDQPEQWAMANPNLGVSVFQDYIEDKVKKARQSAAALNNFKTKHLNIWINAALAFFNMDRWKACEDKTLQLFDAAGDPDPRFAGQKVFIGLDLASEVDLAEVVYEFADLPEGQPLTVFGSHYLPRDLVDERASTTTGHYLNWAREREGGLAAWLTLTDGTTTDYDRIEAEILRAAELFHVVTVAHDPWQAHQLVGHLMAKGIECVKVPPNVGNFSPAMKDVEGRMQSGRIRHCGDPVAAWQISNVVARRDFKGNVYPRKEREQNKIDFATALFESHSRIVAQEEPVVSPYETRGILSY
jgi:phage terminase large subunit-like protein